MRERGDPSPERVLVLAPTGQDGAMVRERLVAWGFTCEICDDVDELIAALRYDAGTALIAQEALSAAGAKALLAALAAQEPWSDVPVLLMTMTVPRRALPPHPAVELLERANVIILRRPMPLHVLSSAVRSAVRARRRQYQMRDLHRELERAVQLGDLFVSILGHDLRTPLGAIKMSGELIVRSADDARSLRSAGRILTAADRMTRMIEQLLDFARFRQGKGIRLRLVVSDLGDIARQILQELGDANPQASFRVSSSGCLTGCWDPDRLAQVVSNLLGNAVQHGNAGSSVAVELEGTLPDVVRFRVENRGDIPAEAVPTLFEPFKRSMATEGRESGLGLGLFIAREIVRAHGGELAVRTGDGVTRFDAMLPREARPIETEVLTPH